MLSRVMHVTLIWFLGYTILLSCTLVIGGSAKVYLVRYEELKDNQQDIDPPNVFMGKFIKVPVLATPGIGLAENALIRFIKTGSASISRTCPLLPCIAVWLLMLGIMFILGSSRLSLFSYFHNAYLDPLRESTGQHSINNVTTFKPESSSVFRSTLSPPPNILWHDYLRANQTIIKLTRSGRYLEDPKVPYPEGEDIFIPRLRYIFPKHLAYLKDTPSNRNNPAIYPNSDQKYSFAARECVYVIETKSCILPRFNAMPYTKVPKEDALMLNRWGRQLGLKHIYQMNNMGLCILCTMPKVSVEYLDSHDQDYLNTGKITFPRYTSRLLGLKKKCHEILPSTQCVQGGKLFLRNDQVEQTDMQVLEEWTFKKGGSNNVQKAIDANGVCLQCRID